MLLVPDSYSPVAEAYYGKPKEFKYIEKELAKIIDMIENIFDGTNTKIDINRSKELKNIENAFTEYFKVKECNVSFYSPGNPIDGIDGIFEPNAYTIPTSFACFIKDKNNKKIADASKLFLNVNVDIRLIHSLQLTPGELMGVILHEIGHCFDAAYVNIASYISIDLVERLGTTPEINTAIAIANPIISMLTATYPLQKIMIEINKILSSLLSKIPMLQTSWNYATLFISNVIETLHELNPHIPSIGKMLVNYLNPRNIFGYGKEKFADSFATTYGYGPEISSMFTKINKGDKNRILKATKDIPVLNIGVDLLNTSSDIIGLLTRFGPHPADAARVQAQVNKLKNDLKDPNLKPEVRRMIESDIDDIERIINTKLLDIKENSKKGEISSTLLNILIIKGFNGKIDPRECIQFLHEEL